MTNKSATQKKSETALFAALRRALANKEYPGKKFGPDDLAEHFLPSHFKFFLKFKQIRANTKNKLNGLLPGLNEYIIARTIFFDHLFEAALKNQTPQIVLLGAGYDSRAYRFAGLNDQTRIFELDGAPTQKRKRDCLKKARIGIPKFVTFVPINFNEESLKTSLENAGYQNDQKTLFIWEGVSYYLDAESVSTLLKFVGEASHPETTIAFDYAVSISDDTIEDYYGVKEFLQTMKKHHSNEKLLFTLNERETESYLLQKGLEMVDHFDKEKIESTFLLNSNKSLIGQITGNFRFVSASPKNRMNPKKRNIDE